MEYDQPRKRLTGFGLGLLSGNLLNEEGALNNLQDNLQFRIQSAREMLTGNASMSPMERRQELRSRRMELLGMGTGDGGSPSSSSRRGRSGRIGESGTSRSSPSVQSGTPSMSDVDRGTKKRAQDRGFGT